MMNLIFTPIRFVLGYLIRAIDALTRPKPMVRAPEAQAKVDAETRSLVLYQFVGCPFCVKVRRQIHRLGLRIELKNVEEDPVAEKELLAGGGERQVPCLRITENGNVRWMYESSDINTYLSQRFGTDFKA